MYDRLCIFAVRCTQRPLQDRGDENSVEKRVKQLQTGCGTPIHIVDTFKSEDYYRIETLLHRRFGHKKEQGEWFSLDSSDVARFNEYCKQMQSLIDCVNYPRTKDSWALAKG